MVNIYRLLFTYFKKYGIRDYRGGGRASARETACRVAGGAIAKKFLQSKGIKVLSFVEQIGNIKMDYNSLDDISVDKDNFSLPCRQVTVRRVHLIRTLVYIVQLDPVVPVPGNMMSRKQPAFIIVTHKGKFTGIL